MISARIKRAKDGRVIEKRKNPAALRFYAKQRNIESIVSSVSTECFYEQTAFVQPMELEARDRETQGGKDSFHMTERTQEETRKPKPFQITKRAARGACQFVPD